MKTAEFNDLCNREHEQDGGVVAALHLTLESYHELLADVLAEPVELTAAGGPVGAVLNTMINPATQTTVSVFRIPASDTAEVQRRGNGEAVLVPCRTPDHR